MLDHDVKHMEYLMSLLIENFWLFCCVANSLEDGCLPCISATNDEDAKTCSEPSSILCLSLLSFYILRSSEFGIGKGHLLLGCLRWWKWWWIEISTQAVSAWAVYCLVTHLEPKVWHHSLIPSKPNEELKHRRSYQNNHMARLRAQNQLLTLAAIKSALPKSLEWYTIGSFFLGLSSLPWQGLARNRTKWQSAHKLLSQDDACLSGACSQLWPCCLEHWFPSANIFGAPSILFARSSTRSPKNSYKWSRMSYTSSIMVVVLLRLRVLSNLSRLSQKASCAARKPSRLPALTSTPEGPTLFRNLVHFGIFPIQPGTLVCQCMIRQSGHRLEQQRAPCED